MFAIERADGTLMDCAFSAGAAVMIVEMGKRFGAGRVRVFLVPAIMFAVVVRAHRHERGQCVTQQQHPPIGKHER